MKNIAVISGYDYDINNWKISKTNQQSIFDYLIATYNVIDVSISTDKYKLKLNELF